MNMEEKFLIAVLLFAPLIGFLINGLGQKKLNKSINLSGGIGTLAALVSFASAATLFSKLLGAHEENARITAHFAEWFNVAGFKANFGFAIDPVSGIMILIITGIGSLIHLYSIGYMGHDPKPAKFFCYLNLFLFNMLVLVLGDNLLLLFVGWEGVGLCSYLLIGFWFEDPEKAAAGMKAFVVNRIGDAAFLLGLFMLFTQFGTIDFAELAAKTYTKELTFGALSLATLLLFVGATGKSAQIPLYVWLPDAMAGPTPVSALIHAATMVTAGIYLIVRLNFIFVATPITMSVIAVVGAVTALFAATIGVLQNDIKKVLAYSTVSQLGYMFLGVGVGAFTAGFFHLMTHAFFKALMFLGAGSVIYGMHHEQDIQKMGGLKDKMPITHWTFVCGWLAIIGTPGLSGFFSKDEILWMAYSSEYGSPILWGIGVVAAGFTAFYMTRLMALTFWGKSRVAKDVHPHESPWMMTLPLCILAVLSVVGGWIGLPKLFSATNHFEHFLEPIVKNVEGHGDHTAEILVMAISVSLALLMAFWAWALYTRWNDVTERWAKLLKPLHKLLFNKYFVDELYFGAIVNPLVKFSRGLWAYFDVRVVDRTTFLVSDVVRGTGVGMRLLVNGSVQQYALYVVLGVVISIIAMIMR